MEVVTTVKAALTIGQEAKKHWKTITISVGSFLTLTVMSFMALTSSSGDSGNTGTGKVNEDVMAWKPVVQEYAEKYKVPDYVDVILAIIMVETGGSRPDIMQSSESLGLPPNTITDPVTSIDAGVRHFSAVIKNAEKNGLDFWTPVQSYNYGSGFNNYVNTNGKVYSFELASAFSKKQANGKTVKYSNPIADFNGNFRYAYGNMYYVMLVQQYISAGSAGGGVGNADASALGAKAYQQLMNEVFKYEGWPYVWAGAGPKTGFDCSGLTQYSYGQIGYKLPRTAAEQHQSTVPVSDPQPGDLIFFKGTNSSRPASSITHVGIYVDEKRMYDSNSSGVGYSTWNTGYWKQHLAGFGRITK